MDNLPDLINIKIEFSAPWNEQNKFEIEINRLPDAVTALNLIYTPYRYTVLNTPIWGYYKDFDGGLTSRYSGMIVAITSIINNVISR